MKWIKLRRKTHTVYRSEDRKWLLSPITAPIGKHLPKFILYKMKDGKAEKDMGSFFEVECATDAIEKWENKHCCKEMNRNIEQSCDVHSNPFDCPDCLVSYSSKTHKYGLIVHDGGSSVIKIQFCPWCGKKLK